MKKSLGVLLLTGALVPACNSKSPEQTAATSQSTEVPAVEAPAPTPVVEEKPEPPDALVGPHRVAFDLLANRPLSHVLQVAGDSSAVTFDAGARGFVRYAAGNHAGDWMATELDGRAAMALSKTRTGKLFVPSTTVDAMVIEAEVFNPADRANELTLHVNGTKLDAGSVEPGWQTISVAVPAEAARYENTVEVEFASMGRVEGKLSGGGIGKVRIGSKLDGVEFAADERLAEEQGALTIAPGTGTMWHLWSLPEANIELEFEGPENCAFDYQFWREKSGGGAELIVKESRKVAEAGKPQTTVLNPGTSGEVVRFELRANAETCPEGVKVARAGLYVPGEAPNVPAAAPKYVLFWLVDTLRADHLPIHFETDVQAPNLKRLAEEGASFKLAYVQGNESKTSHASLFAGMYPSKHRVLGRGHLKPHHYLLPEAMADSGFKTYAYISNGYVSQPWGFVQGWTMYRNNLREGYGIDGPAMAKHSLDLATKKKDDPFFLYVGTIDPHVTYREHDELIGKYDTEPYKGRFKRSCLGTDLGKIKGGGIKVDDRDKKRIHALYKNEIEYNDGAFGELRKGLEELGIWDETMVVITSDHGDEFWEHDSVGHGHSVHQELVHVPLIVRYPPLIPPNTVIEAGVDVLDIYPTIMDAVGKKRPDDLQGKSLLPLIYKVTGDYPEPAIATQYLSRYGIQLQQWKMIAKKGAYAFYDRSKDPAELTDVSGKHPFAERWVQDSFGWFRANRSTWDKTTHGPASNLSPTFLEKLGTSED